MDIESEYLKEITEVHKVYQKEIENNRQFVEDTKKENLELAAIANDFRENQKFLKKNNKYNVCRFKHPLLVIHGKADIVTKCTDSIKFYNNAGSSDKTLKIIPHAYHEPIHDVESDVYKSAILDFLEERYQTAPNFGKF